MRTFSTSRPLNTSQVVHTNSKQDITLIKCQPMHSFSNSGICNEIYGYYKKLYKKKQPEYILMFEEVFHNLRLSDKFLGGKFKPPTLKTRKW